MTNVTNTLVQAMMSSALLVIASLSVAPSLCAATGSEENPCPDISITAMIPYTPVKTERTKTLPDPMSREFDSNQTEPSWTAGNAILLLERAADKIQLVAQTTTPIKWEVFRSSADNKALRASPYPAVLVPTLTPNGNTATLALDAVGSFSVVAFVDKDGSGLFKPDVFPVARGALIIDTKGDLLNIRPPVDKCAVFWNIIIGRVESVEQFSGAHQNFTNPIKNGSFPVNDGTEPFLSIFLLGQEPSSSPRRDDQRYRWMKS